MAIYTVHMPPERAVERARFIREGPNLFALLLPPVWLIWHRLWLALLALVAYDMALAAAGRWVGPVPAAALSLLPAIYFYLEGNELLRGRLARAGWSLVDVIAAGDAREAELRFFGAADTASPQASPKAPPSMAFSPGIAPSARPAQGIGLFDQ